MPVSRDQKVTDVNHGNNFDSEFYGSKSRLCDRSVHSRTQQAAGIMRTRNFASELRPQMTAVTRDQNVTDVTHTRNFEAKLRV